MNCPGVQAKQKNLAKRGGPWQFVIEQTQVIDSTRLFVMFVLNVSADVIHYTSRPNVPLVFTPVKTMVCLGQKIMPAGIVGDNLSIPGHY